MYKIKVSKEVKENLDGLLFGSDEKAKIVYLAFHLTKSWSGYKELNKLSYEDFSKAIIFGYELEKTPEEKLFILYENCTSADFDRGVQYGIEKTLEKLKIEIKGINA